MTCDDYLGGRLVADHFLELGHERAAVIAGEPYASTGIDRTAGFADRYREAGMPLPASRIVPSHFDASGGRRAAEQLLRGPDRPTAVFAVNDFAAIGAMGTLRDHGLRPGKDVAVAGFNDIPPAAELFIPLTTVRSPMHAIGARGLDLLVRLLEGRPVESARLTPELVVRASSDPSKLSSIITDF